MGSSGTGSFTDYPGGAGGGSTSHGEGSGSGKPGAEDRCSKVFSADLEDVAMSEFYVGTKALPAVGTRVSIAQRKRLVAQTEDGASIGSLPTAYNYLAGCLKAGWSYVGVVRASSAGKLGPAVSVDFTPIPSQS